MSVGPTPVNQIDALPLITAAQAATAGTVQLIGGTMFRRFTPAQLGINATAAAMVGSCALIATNWLDLRGTSKYLCAVRCTNALVTAARPAFALQAQFRLGSTDTPSPSMTLSGSYNVEFNGVMTVNDNCIFPAAAAGQALTKLISWDAATVPPGGLTRGTAIFGPDIRFIISFLGANLPAADNVFTMYLEASS